MPNKTSGMLLLMLMMFAREPVYAGALCGSASCQEARATVQGYIDGQARSFFVTDHQAWLTFTTLDQAPTWPTITLFKTAKIAAVACASSDACTAEVAYDTIGTSVPLETFDARPMVMSVTYKLVRKDGRLLIADPLPAKFVDVETSVARTGGMLTGSLAMRYYYDGLAERIAAAAR